MRHILSSVVHCYPMGRVSNKYGVTGRVRMRTASGEPAHTVDNSANVKSAWLSRPIRLIIICGIILVGAVIAATAGLLLNLRDRDLADGEGDLSRLTLVLAEQIDQTFQSVELVQTAVVERMQSLGIAWQKTLNGRCPAMTPTNVSNIKSAHCLISTPLC